MGEIKSTLDLVMEKTKHLSMTNEEKAVKKNEEICLAVKGLVQKYQDQILNLEMFRKELKVLHQQVVFEDKDVLLNEMMSRFDLESDNSSILKLFKDVLHIDSAELKEILNQHKNELKELADSKAEETRDEFKEKYSISGSAVVPNIEDDLSWQTAVNDIQTRFHLKLDEVKSEIVNQ